MDSASGRDSAWAMAWAVGGVRRTPRLSWAMVMGWAPSGAVAWAKASDHPIRLTMASGAAQASASSAQPFGEGALNGCWPRLVSTGPNLVKSSGATPRAR